MEIKAVCYDIDLIEVKRLKDAVRIFLEGLGTSSGLKGGGGEHIYIYIIYRIKWT